MSGSIPLGKKEDSQLEFKGADALKEPEKIAREVVAMLNAEGGEVWVGLREDGGRAVGVEPIAAPETEERRLLDFLVDTIEPSVSDREIKVRSVDEGEGAVLRIAVTPDRHRKPYAFLKRGGRYFVVRVGDRIRLMTREEVLSQTTFPDQHLELAESRVLQDRNALLSQEEEVFWLRLQPGVSVLLDIQDARLKELLQDPQLSGNRLEGWNFSKFEYRPRIRQDKLRTDPEDYRIVEIRRDGGLVFAAPLESLFWKGEEQEIWPPILMEYIVSTFRIAREIYRGLLKASGPVVADLVLAKVQGWKLRAGTPGDWFPTNRARTFMHASDFVLAQPLVFRFEEIEENPDRCGYRLIERVYEAFGLERENIPKLFDESGRLQMRNS